MNNYAILLEQFHFYQQQQTASHEQFAEIIDYIRNQKQTKQSLMIRKKQLKAKLTHRLNKIHQKSLSMPKIKVIENSFQDVHDLQEINNTILRKENQVLQKQVTKIRKQVKEKEDQLAVFNRKQNQIKQLKYSSKRELDNCYMQLRNQKLLNLQLQQKHDRVIEQLVMQKSNLQHQNRFLVDQLHQIKHLTRNAMKNNGQLVVHGFDTKIDEIYSKKKIQERLRCLYVLFVGSSNWQTKKLNNFNQIIGLAHKDLHTAQHFNYLSKKQIFQYYQKKLKQKTFLPLPLVRNIMEFYSCLTNKIKQLQAVNTYLNNYVSQLKQQYEKYEKIFADIQVSKVKNTLYFIKSCEAQNQAIAQQVRIRCRSIIQILCKQFKLVDKLRKVLCTLQTLMDNTDAKTQNKFLNVIFHQNRQKRKSSFLKDKDKRSSDNLASTKNISHELQIGKNSSLNLSTFTDLNNKSTLHQFRFPIYKPDKILVEFQHALFRNPKQIICKWEEVIKDERGMKFLHCIFRNDLFRVFVDPCHYNANLEQIQNYSFCINKVFDNIYNLASSLKNNLVSNLQTMLQAQKQNQNQHSHAHSNVNVNVNCNQKQNQNYMASSNNNNKSVIIEGINSVPQLKYVIQSKGYYRFDNFKLLERLEMLQTKKKGLFIPFRYGVDMQQELIVVKNRRKQIKKDSLDKVKINLSNRQPRNTAPEAKNYISSYRERVNKADKKIRDLLNNIDSLKILKKSARQMSTRESRRNTDISIISG